MSTLFWDFDGTLVYSYHLWSGSMYRALTAVCPHTTVRFSHIRECNTRGFTWQTPQRDHTALIGEAWWHAFEAHAYGSFLSCGVSDAAAAAAASLVRTFIVQPDRYHLFEDTLDTLRQMRDDGHQNVLLSNNYPELTVIMEALGLLPFFNGVILSAAEGYDKPRQELFAIAKARFPDRNYYMIGDNPNADIIGGKSAGMKTILVHNGHDPRADHCVDRLSDIPAILKSTAP